MKAPEMQERERAELEALRAQACEQGRIEGHREAATRLEGAIEQLHTLARSLADQRAQVLMEARTDIGHLVIEVAGRVIHGELRARPEIVIDIVRDCLQIVSDANVVRLRLHPADVDLLREHAAMGSIATPELVGDSSLERGDCMIDSSRGTTDARISTALDNLRKQLAGQLS